MRKVTITNIREDQNDVLIVEGTLEGVLEKYSEPEEYETVVKYTEETLNEDGEKQEVEKERTIKMTRLVEKTRPQLFRGRGWVSATKNFYDQSSILKKDLFKEDKDGTKHVIAAAGQRDPNAKPREMTTDELHEYCKDILLTQFTEFMNRKEQ